VMPVVYPGQAQVAPPLAPLGRMGSCRGALKRMRAREGLLWGVRCTQGRQRGTEPVAKGGSWGETLRRMRAREGLLRGVRCTRGRGRGVPAAQEGSWRETLRRMRMQKGGAVVRAVYPGQGEEERGPWHRGKAGKELRGG